MTAEIVIRGEVSLKGIEEMQGELIRLKAALAGEAPPRAAAPQTIAGLVVHEGPMPWVSSPTKRFVDRVIQMENRGSKNGWLFLKAAFQLRDFSFEEIAKKLDVEPAQANAYNRNLGRTAGTFRVQVLMHLGGDRYCLQPDLKAELQKVFDRKK